MKGLLFATILLSSAAPLTSGDIDVEAAIRREALSYGADEEQVPSIRGDVRVKEDLDEPIALSFLVAARRTRENDERPLVIVSRVQNPLEKRYLLNRMVMENPMYVDEPGFTDIMQTNDNNQWNRLQSSDYPINRGKRIYSHWSTNDAKPKQNDHRVRIRKREIMYPVLNPLDMVFPKGKKNYLVNAKELSRRVVPWNDAGGDGDWTLAKSLESIKEEDHFARRSTRSKKLLTLQDRMDAPILFHLSKSKRTRKPTVYESTGSV